MAAVLGRLFRLNTGLVNNPFPRKFLLNGNLRFLYTDRALGLTGYENTRLSYRNQFVNIENSFRTKMNEVCGENQGMIFTEDLKAMLHLLQKQDDDLKLIENMIQKFNSQSNDFRFGNFVFGPVVMRAFYYLGEPDIALKLFKTPELESFFSQSMTYQILMSLLFKNERYNDMKDVYNMIRSRSLDSVSFPSHTLTLIMAACCKDSTQESYEYAMSVWKEMIQRGRFLPRRAIAFAALAAVNQGAPHVAIEMLSNIRNKYVAELRSLKVLAYTKLCKFTEIIPILRTSLEVELPGGRKETYFYDVIEELSRELKITNDHNDLLDVVMQIKNNGHVSNDTLESFLCRPLDVMRRTNASEKNMNLFRQTARNENFRQSAASNV